LKYYKSKPWNGFEYHKNESDPRFYRTEEFKIWECYYKPTTKPSAGWYIICPPPTSLDCCDSVENLTELTKEELFIEFL